MDPFRSYANAIRDALAVLDPFHVVRLGTHLLHEVRRRIQQAQTIQAAAAAVDLHLTSDQIGQLDQS